MLVFSLVGTKQFVVDFLVAVIGLGSLRKVKLERQNGKSSPILYVGKQVQEVMEVVAE
jgi:hypothetical protein